MSSARVIFDGVWKKFRRGPAHDSLRDFIPSLFRRALNGRSDDLEEQEFWALRKISFEVHPGDALGIIGPNGAGKSTVLKLLSRILKPNRGRCEIRGRFGALIEVAAGFHPDLTGRENIYFQGAIMGMKRAEIKRKLDEIIDFAGIGEFIDTPVKRYSSGMEARLGFSIAGHLDPDVLLVDEVLAVGDLSFQKRCVDRMQEKLASGVAVVFVSHNLPAVMNLCPRTLVLSRGQRLFEGSSENAVEFYTKASGQGPDPIRGEDALFRLQEVTLRQASGDPADVIAPHVACELEVLLVALSDPPPLSVGVTFERTRDLFRCFRAATEDLGHELIHVTEGQGIRMVFRFRAHFSRGHYRINVEARDPRGARSLFKADSVATFVVEEDYSRDGIVAVEPQVTLETVKQDATRLIA
jgi:lipopolysaccharide transport system ATP-binding protein